MDIDDIAQHSFERWGVVRTERYILELHAVFRRLAAFPEMGQDVGHIRPEYMRVRSGSHLVFYRGVEMGMLIVRVLHQSMDTDRYL